MNLKQLERIVNYQLEQFTLEEFLEEFDITPLDVFVLLYDEGLIDEELLKSFTPVHED